MKHKGWKVGWLVVLMGALIVGYGGVSPDMLKAANSSIGVVSQIMGNAWIIGEGGELIPLEAGMFITLGTEIKCAGNITISFNDGSSLSLQPGSKISISESGELVMLSGNGEYTTPGGNLVMLTEGGNTVTLTQASLDFTPTSSGLQYKASPVFPAVSGGAPEPVDPASPSQ